MARLKLDAVWGPSGVHAAGWPRVVKAQAARLEGQRLAKLHIAHTKGSLAWMSENWPKTLDLRSDFVQRYGYAWTKPESADTRGRVQPSCGSQGPSEQPSAKDRLVIRLRPATLRDLELLRGWDAAPHVIAAKGVEDWGWETELAERPNWREQLIAEVNGVAVGFVQIIDPAREVSHYWGDCPAGLRAIDIWIGEENYLARGFGTQIMKHAIERCFSSPSVSGIVIDPLASNARARRFYERLGFTFVENRRFGDDECAVYELTRQAYRA